MTTKTPNFTFDEPPSKPPHFSWWERKVYFPLYRIWNKITDIPDEIKWFIQRGKRGYADCDVWSLDSYICSWLPSALRTFKVKKWGHPENLKNQREWNNTLEKMARGFESGEKMMDWSFMSPETKPEVWKPKQKKLQRQFDEGMKLFHKYFFHLWD